MAQGKKANGEKVKQHKDKRLPSPEELIQIKVLTGIGYNTQGLADEFGISKDLIEQWIKRIPEVSSAIKAGRAARRKRTYACVFQQAFPTDERGRPTGKGDSGLIRYYLGCREGWREREKRIKIEGNASQTPIVQYVIKEELDADKEKERVKTKK